MSNVLVVVGWPEHYALPGRKLGPLVLLGPLTPPAKEHAQAWQTQPQSPLLSLLVL